MNDAVIGIGSNIDPQAHVDAAISRLDYEFELVSLSSMVWTDPIGRPEQDKYLNGVARIRTPLDQDHLKRALHRIEDDLGRARGADKFAPRTIDLDVVVFNGRIVDEDIHTRDFLRSAVLEVAPDISV
jgi:2-amino-4-hydroxy-6-hydroxymethyldihydropteridine diphosphokinase